MLAALLGIAALWLTTHSYQGIFHDSRLYTLQALSRWYPGRYSEDLFLAYGSQDQFSVFASLYAPALALLGNAGGNIAMLALCAVGWVAAALLLARGCFGGWPVALAAAATAIALPGGIAFRYAEPYLTPRLLAEALTLAGLGLMMRRQLLPSVLALITAMAIHPLMTIPGCAVLLVMQARQHRWLWALAAIGIAAILALAGVGIEPFSRLTERFDPTWLAIVASRNPHCLVSEWGDLEWSAAANIFAAVAVAWSLGRRQARPLLLAAAGVGAAGMLIAWVGGDMMRNVLITDIQAWRWTWLTAAVAHLYLGALLFDVLRGDARLSRLELFLLAVSVVMLAASRFFYQAGALLAPIMLVLATVGTWRQLSGRTPPRWIAIIVIYAVVQLLVFATGVSSGVAGIDPNVMAIARAASAVALLGGILALAAGRVTAPPAVVLVISGLAVSAAGIAWDQRTLWRRYVDNVHEAPTELVAMLPKTGGLYWEGDMTALWLMLQQPSYFSCDQGAGVLFSRGTAISYAARASSFGRLGGLDFRQFDFCPLPGKAPSPPRRIADLVAVCRQEPRLGALILATPVVAAPGQTWTPPVPFELPLGDGGRFRSGRFHIYVCGDYR